MNIKEQAFEIAQKVIRMEAEIEARGALLDYLCSRSDSQWQPRANQRINEILTSEKIQERSTELESTFNSAKDGDSLIGILHSEILRRVSVS
jgi:hypothetical protein